MKTLILVTSIISFMSCSNDNQALSTDKAPSAKAPATESETNDRLAPANSSAPQPSDVTIDIIHEQQASDQQDALIEPTDIVIIASRDYNPSFWQSHQSKMSFSATMKVPVKMNVITGNSGTGWATLQIATRKFCYQGMAMNNRTANGSLFVLKSEKQDISTSCHEDQNNVSIIDRKVDITAGDLVELVVNGGGCSDAMGMCLFTEIEAELKLVQ